MSAKGRCRICEKAIVWHPTRSAWAHAQPGADHAPMPAKEARR